MAQFTKIKNVDGTITGFFGETLYRASEVDPYIQALEAEKEALRSGRPFKLEQCITFEDIVRGEG